MIGKSKLIAILTLAGLILAAGGNSKALAQDKRITCESSDGNYNYCRVDTDNKVQLERKLSLSECRYGSSWGYDKRGIWVNRGCRAEFTYGGSSSGKTAVAVGNDASAKDLNWFWNAWYFSNGYIDLGLGLVSTNADKTEITLKNTGGFPAPVDVVVTYADNSSEAFHQTPAIWQSNLSETKISVPTKKPVKSVVLDGGIFMDANPKDNKWEGN